MPFSDDPTVTYSVGDFHVEGKQNGPARLRVSRAVYDQPSFDATYGLCDPGPPLTPWESVKRYGRRIVKKTRNKRCNAQTFYRGLVKWIPFIGWIQKYDVRANLITDFIAGITVGVLNVPQGMAYALLAACPPVTGLYTSFFPIIVYFLMGTSRQCSIGTFSITSMMTSRMVLNANPVPEKLMSPNGTFYSNPEFSELINGSSFTKGEWGAIQVGGTAALFVGIWQLILGLIGAGGMSVYFSDQLVQGFTCGASFHVFSSQLKSVFKLPMIEYYGPFKLIKTWIQFFKLIKQTHIPTLVVAIICLVVLIIIKIGINDNKRIMRKLRVPLPAELVIVVFGTLASYEMDLYHNYGVSILKNIPMGLPPPSVPDLRVLPNIIGDTFSNAIVGLAITVTLGMLFASKHGYRIDPNQEFKAQGIGNIFGAFFQCFPSGASLARSAVQNDVGGKTQIVSVVQCIIVLIVMLALGKFLEPLPKPCLGAIVMVSVLHLLAQVVQLHKLWKLSLYDWSIFLVVFFGVLILDVDIGLGIGVGWAIITIMLRLQKPKIGALGRLPGTDIYRRTDVYKTALEVPGVKIVRIDSPIYFANVTYIQSRLYQLADLNNLIVKWREEHPVKELITPATYDDVDGNGDKYAYALNLQLDANDEDEDDSSSRHRGAPTISMEELHDTKRRVMEQEGILEGGQNQPVKHIVVDCSEVCFVDVTGVGFFKRIQIECDSIGVELLLACTNKPFRDAMYQCGASEYVKEFQVFVTVHDAVLYAVNAHKFNKPTNTKLSIVNGNSNGAVHGYTNGVAPQSPVRRGSLADVIEAPEEDEARFEGQGGHREKEHRL